jgi:predicted acetylornithine/succinylornithine family transaminase
VSVIVIETKALMKFSRRYPLVLARGEGMKVFDEQDRGYWDFLAGIGVSSLGHNHPRVRAAICQAIPLLHTSNWYWNRSAVSLAEALSRLSNGKEVFFCNSGTEANEAGLKLLRRFGKADGRYQVVSMLGGFHGRTMGTMAMTPTPQYRDPFRPLPDGFLAVAYNDPDALEVVLRKERPAGVVMEAIQGESGVVVPDSGYLRQVSDLCHRYGALLMIDAVQTGMGRTGSWFGFEHEPQVQPDVITLAKGLGAGIPIGAVLARSEVADALKPGEHGTTFGGNPLATAVGGVVVSWLEEEGLDHVQRIGAVLERHLWDLKARHPQEILEVRGRGLMWGMVLSLPNTKVVERAMAHGLLVNAAGGNVLRMLPPLIVDETAILAAMAILDQSLTEVSEES